MAHGIMSIPNLIKFRPTILQLLDPLSDTSLWFGMDLVRLGLVRLMARIRKVSWVMASSFHLTTSSNRHVRNHTLFKSNIITQI